MISVAGSITKYQTPNSCNAGPSSQAPKPAPLALPAKSPFTAVPIADPDTDSSLIKAQKKHRPKKAITPISPAELAKGSYRRVSRGVYKLVDDPQAASRPNHPISRVSCSEGEVQFVTLLGSVSMDKDYGTYTLTWDKQSGFRKLPKTPVEPKEITMREVVEFRLDAENSAKKNPGKDVDKFIKNHPAFYDDPVQVIEADSSDIMEINDEPPRPPPLPHSVLSVMVASLPLTDALDVRFRGEPGGKDYTIGYEAQRSARSGGRLVKMVDGSSQKLDPSPGEMRAFTDAVIEICRKGDRKVSDFVSRYPDVIHYP